jgi:putative Holliday junction resolvase
MPDTPETILAFDFGLRRIGVAVGQQVTDSASPIGVIANNDEGPDWGRIGDLLREWQPGRLIVGLPLHADGSPSDMSDIVRSFVAELERFEIPVELVDERFSSTEAETYLKHMRAGGLRGRIGKEAIDAASAVLIAERWLKMKAQ